MSYFIPVWVFFYEDSKPQTIQEDQASCCKDSPEFEQNVENIVEENRWKMYLEIFKNYLSKRSKRNMKKKWKNEEDQLLIDFYGKGNNWEEISQNIAKSSPQICKRRYERLQESLIQWPLDLDTMIKKLAYSEELDWASIHRILYSNKEFSFPKHSLKEIKERYLLNLRPGLVNDYWSVEEDLSLLTEIKTKGTHWRKLTSEFVGRTELQLKNRYYGTLRPLERKVTRKLSSMIREFENKSNSLK